MKTTFRSLLLAVCASLALGTASATTVIPPTFDELVGQAELIFQGTVTDVRSEWVGEGAERRIVSYVTFNVDEPLKGNAGSSYTIRMLGGTVGDRTMEVTDSPKFKVGDRDILFVENNGRQFIPLVGIMHGRYRVQQDKGTGDEVLLTNQGDALADVKQLGKDDGHGHHAAAASAAATAGIRPAEFKALIRAKLANSQQ
jgi:hypothetical protein